MYRDYNDLRILRLALQMEDTFERYEAYLRDLIPEVGVRAKLAGLFQGGAGHEALRAAHARLSAKLRRRQEDLGTEEILQTLRDCESWAADFYLHQLDRLSDPTLVELFRRLAQEEEGHARLVDHARDLLAGLHAQRPSGAIRPTA